MSSFIKIYAQSAALFGALLSMSPLIASDFEYRSLDGQKRTISEWPAFVITSKAEADLKDALRFATLLASLEARPHWLIDFAWPRSTISKRLAAKTLLKSAFMKAHSTVLEEQIPNTDFISLVSHQRQILWSSSTYPSDEDWQRALAILEASTSD